MMNIEHILAPVDLGDSSRRALSYARSLAEQFDARITLLYVDDSMTLQSYDTMYTGYGIPEEQAKAVESEVREFASANLGGRECAVAVVGDDPALAISRAADRYEADTIVMGTHARTGMDRVFVRSVAENVLRMTNRPILAVPPMEIGERATVKRVVCPINFSDLAREAALAACRLSKSFGADLYLVHVVENGQPDVELSTISATFKEWLGAPGGDCNFRKLVVRSGGGAAERVLDAVEDLDADLLVVGARQKAQHTRTVIGTTTEQLVRNAPCPVFSVVRPVRPATVAQTRRAHVFAH